MTVKEITIGTDYTDVPGGRYIKYGPYSGEDFRNTVLVPALKGFEKVVVWLDGTKSYMGSFLEEAFGGLIRVSGFSFEDLQRRLEVGSKDQKYRIYVRMVEQDLKDAAEEAKHGAQPRVA